MKPAPFCSSAKWPASAAFLAAWTVIVVVHAAAPTLTQLVPAGGQRGTTVAVQCRGKFDWPVQVWAPGVDVSVGEKAGELAIAIPADLATDRIWLRLFNDEGASELRPLLIGSLRELAEEETNDAPDSAQHLGSSPVTVNGVLSKRGDVDGYAVELKAGQTLVASVDAHEDLGSPIDVMLQVATPDGLVLAGQHDDVGLDPRMAFTAPSDGTYVVRLFAFASQPNTTIAYHGGEDCIYRLTLTTGPFITHAAPLAVSLSDPGLVEPRGYNIPPKTRLPVVALGGTRSLELHEVETNSDGRYPPESQLGFVYSADFAGAARVRLTPYPFTGEAVESTVDPPQEWTPPFAWTGCFLEPGHEDLFRLPLSKGQQVVIAVESPGLELPLHPIVRLVDSAGKVVAKAEPRYAEDAVISHAVGRDDTYELRIRDLYQQAGPRCMYRLGVRLDEPDFVLTASTDAIVVTPEKPAELVVAVKRRKTPAGAVGPITIGASDLPPGVSAPAVTSEPSGPTAEKVTLVFSSAGEAYRGPIRISGKATAPRDIERDVLTPAKFGASLATIWLTVAPRP